LARRAPVSVPWDAVDRLVDGFEVETACEHGLGPWAARLRRRRGEELPERLMREERSAAAGNLVAPTLLARACDAYDGPLLLLKGPELANRYPDRARRFGDLDLLPADAEAAQAALLAAGFRLQDREWPPAGWDDVKNPHYHLHPLEWPGLALRVELHKTVKWPVGMKPPPNEDLFAGAVPASVGVDGLLAPSPDHHAVILASHAWGEVPMRHLRELVDVLAFVDDTRRDELLHIARRWRFERGWVSTLEAADWILGGAPEPGFVRFWARYLRELREPTVVEMHVQEWLAPFWLAAFPTALKISARAFLRDFTPEPEQSWGDKARQTLQALLHPLSPKSEHDRRHGRSAGGAHE
jgi:hypothetical protein